MQSPELFAALPDLLLLVRRDGTIVAHAGGKGVPELGVPVSAGAELAPSWSEPTAALIRHLVRRALADRATTESEFAERDNQYEIRVQPLGVDRALCVIRPSLRDTGRDALEQTGEHRRLRLDRRGFLRRFKEATSFATLRELPVAVAVLYIEEIADIAQVIATKVSEQIMSTALSRLPAHPSDGAPEWYIGQLGENLLALVVESTDRDVIEKTVADICATFREPVVLGDAEFRLTPYAGVSILGVDATSPRVLLDHARSAAAEARRAVSREVFFFSDTMHLKSLSRVDVARELREAIASGAVRLRYSGRHDLRTGRLVAWVGYLRWEHSLRGEVRPAEFLRVAQATGLAASLSRSVLAHLPKDFAELGGPAQEGVRISFGALRDHVLHEDFIADMQRFVAESGLPPERLELRIAEKLLVARDPVDFRSLERLGVQLVVDEVGRDVSSLASLARAPVSSLQLDRAWVQALASDPIARTVCRAGFAMATALGLTPIATGVDDEAQRDALLELGCQYGLGDLYGGSAPRATAPSPPAARKASGTT